MNYQRLNRIQSIIKTGLNLIERIETKRGFENIRSIVSKGIELIEQEEIKLGIEIWRQVDSFPNYKVSSKGLVINCKTGRILKQHIGTTGYYHIRLHNAEKGSTLTCKIHRLVATTFVNNPSKKKCVDHINNNRLNNNVLNLRWVTYQENNFNSSISSANTSNVKGVYFDKKRNKWYAQIKFNSKQHHIGSYNTLEEAKVARQNKAKQLFGEYINICEI